MKARHIKRRHDGKPMFLTLVERLDHGSWTRDRWSRSYPTLPILLRLAIAPADIGRVVVYRPPEGLTGLQFNRPAMPGLHISGSVDGHARHGETWLRPTQEGSTPSGLL